MKSHFDITNIADIYVLNNYKQVICKREGGNFKAVAVYLNMGVYRNDLLVDPASSLNSKYFFLGSSDLASFSRCCHLMGVYINSNPGSIFLFRFKGTFSCKHDTFEAHFITKRLDKVF